MRKQTKLVAVLSAAALLAVGASMTSFAATKGWNYLGDGDWEYLDSDGERVTGEWRRSSAGFCFLDDDGLMARNRLVTPDESNDNDDNYYYVNDTGERRKNAWARVDNEEDDEVNDQDVSVLYYYLGSNGKAYKAEEKDGTYKKVTINWMGQDRTFFFDENARMVSGWVKEEDSPNGKVYYCGDEIEGYAYTGWWLLDVPDFIKDQEPADNPYEPAEYFCFEGNGKLRKGDPGKVKTWYDNGWYYTFDDNGVYQDDWYKIQLATDSDIVATPTTADAYTTYSGIEKKAGWVYAENQSGDNKWYYLVTVRQGSNTTRNVPFNSLKNDKEDYRAKLIGKKTYAFNGYGEMLDGLQTFKNDLPEDKVGGAQSKKLVAGTYYFSEDSATKGQMVTGRKSVTDDGETDEYYFAKDGHAYKNAVINDIVYGNDGKRVEADDGNQYEIIEVTWGDLTEKDSTKVVVKQGSKIVVNARGKMVKTSASNTKGKRVKVDDAYYRVTVDAAGNWDCILDDDED